MFQPDKNIRLQISNELESELRKLYLVGTYSDKEIIVKILNSIYEYHYSQICDLIRGVNIKNLASYLLFEYETLNNEDEDIETNLVMYKETILYLLDLLVEKRGYESSSITYFFENEFISRLWVHAENSIKYSNASNFTYKIPHFQTNLEIFPKNSEYFLVHSLITRHKDFLNGHQVNVKQNNILIDKYLQGKDLNEEMHFYLKQEGLKSFEETFQITYYDFFSNLVNYTNSVQKTETPNKIPCISDRHMAGLSKDLNISESNIRILFSGLTLKKENFVARQREIWRYTQQERSRKRPFIEINYGGKKWSLYSPKMVNNRINLLAEDLILSPLDRLPTEWKKNNLQEELAKINTKFGKWFENKTKELLETINVFGYKPGNKLRTNSSDCIKITSPIGPPDFIGYSKFDNSLIVLECKLLDCVFEPNGIYGEYVKFLSVDNKKNYVSKFESKITWIQKNKQAVIDAIKYNCKIKIPDNCKVIHYCFVTYYPTTIRYFYDNIPTPTLFELVDSYNKTKEWPFKHGILI